jgi:hypothetical protein
MESLAERSGSFTSIRAAHAWGGKLAVIPTAKKKKLLGQKLRIDRGWLELLIPSFPRGSGLSLTHSY